VCSAPMSRTASQTSSGRASIRNSRRIDAIGLKSTAP
jgi:hypothetical protein